MSQVPDAAKEEVFTKIAEEAGEIVQAVCKLLQHGEFSYHPKADQGHNLHHLSKELGDMLGLIKWAFYMGYLDPYAVQEAARTKMERVAVYAHNIHVPEGYVPHDL